MPTPFPFVSGAVLTASNLNSISELPTRTLTGSGAAVAADSYSRVILNGTSITYTINTSTFSAGQVVELYNANSTAATIAAGAGVTLNGAAGFTLAQYQTAELYAVSATSFVLWKSDVTQTAAGLVYLTGATFTSQTSVSLPTSTFTSTYRNYKILFVADPGNTTILTGRLRASGTDNTTTNYLGGGRFWLSTGAGFDLANSGATSFSLGYGVDGATIQNALDITLYAPQLATNTEITASFTSASAAYSGIGGGTYGGSFNAATQFDSFTFISSAASSLTGYYRVYGYSDS